MYEAAMQSGEECTDVMVHVYRTTDEIFEDEDKTGLMRLFNIFNNTDTKMTVGQFSYFMADIFADSVQGGDRTGLCKFLQ